MAENGHDTESVELIIPTKDGYKSAGTHQARRAPPPAEKAQTPKAEVPSKPPAPTPTRTNPPTKAAPSPPPPPTPTNPPTKAAPSPPPPVVKSPPKPAPKPAAPTAKPVAAQAKKTNKKKKTMPTDAEGHGALLAESMVTGFVDALNATAAKRGGHLLPEDIAMLSKTFEKQSENIASTITRSMNIYANSQSELQFDPERVNAFDRVLVKQFSHLLKDDDVVAKDPSAISRRVLKGIFVAVRMIAGPERIERYEQDAYLVMQRVRDDLKDAFSWDTVYSDPRTKNMLRDMLVFMAPHFIKLETRMDWLLGVINSNLSDAPPNSPVAEWKLAPASTFVILEALFAELRRNVEDELGRLRLTKQFGGETVDVILELIEIIDNHRAKII